MNRSQLPETEHSQAAGCGVLTGPRFTPGSGSVNSRLAHASGGLIGRRVLELDGLRAIAILMVMCHHLAPHSGMLQWLGSAATEFGWAGVDLFFVLSGFLITSILCNSVYKPHYYRNFIVRRALRILPLYFLFLLLIAAVTYITDRPQWIAFQRWGGVGPYFLYIANIWSAIRHSQSPLVEFRILWSLQVEEQFYLAYPILVALCPRSRLRGMLLAIAATALAGRCAAMALGASPLTTYVMTPFRMDALALGGVIATLHLDGALHAWLPVFQWTFAAGTSIIVILSYSHHIYHQDNAVRSFGFTIIAATAASLLAFALLYRTGLFGRILRLPPLVYTGQIAYGLYILHRLAYSIIYNLTRIVAIRRPVQFILGLAVAYGLASLSWYCFESKVLALKERFSA